MFALDANTLVYFFKGIGRVKEHLLGTPPAEIGIPAVVLFELEVGIEQSTQPSRRRSQLDLLLEVVAVLPFDAQAAKHSAHISAELQARGKVIGPMDTLIRRHGSGEQLHSRDAQPQGVLPSVQTAIDRLVLAANRAGSSSGPDHRTNAGAWLRDESRTA